MRTLALPVLALWYCLTVTGTNVNVKPRSKTVEPEQSNITTCLRGLVGCDISALTPDEIKQVAAASRKHNLDYCLSGSSLCDPTRLGPGEKQSVQASRYRRNLDKCINGSATCDPMQLNPKDASAAQ